MILSAHLLYLVKEICLHVLILRNGQKVVHGIIAEIRQQFSRPSGDPTRKDVFFRATTEPPHAP